MCAKYYRWETKMPFFKEMFAYVLQTGAWEPEWDGTSKADRDYNILCVNFLTYCSLWLWEEYDGKGRIHRDGDKFCFVSLDMCVQYTCGGVHTQSPQQNSFLCCSRSNNLEMRALGELETLWLSEASRSVSPYVSLLSAFQYWVYGHVQPCLTFHVDLKDSNSGLLS